jgi:cholesterol oxidase
VRYPAGSDLMSFLATAMVSSGGSFSRPIQWLLNVIAHPRRTLKTLRPSGWAKRTIILLVMQTLDNSIEIFQKKKWWWPFGKLLVSGKETSRKKVPAEIPIAQVVTEMGAQKIGGVAVNTINEALLNVGTTAHILGGAVMGESSETGVINEKNQVFGYPELYIVDGSMIPANLGVNPSLTITAMAEYAMSHFPHLLK